MKIFEMASKPWGASACSGTAVEAGVPTVFLTVGGQDRLRPHAAARTQKFALLGVAVLGGYVPGTSTPAIAAKRNETKHASSGGLRGPHPWSQPVIT
ncbi:hypothetical protein [Streptosporangium sp. KLBMP 9127]|nr:hypothetical protein [Streptosporangium sp. KLBMP 9127]